MERKGTTDTPSKASDRTWRALLSSPEPDCAGDRVLDWVWSGEKLPLLVGHVTTALPVAVVRPYKEHGCLRGEIEFPEPGTSVASDEARGLLEAGVAGPLSIGFEGRFVRNLYGGRDFASAVVSEVSLVHKAACPPCGVEPRTAKSCGSPPRLADGVLGRGTHTMADGGWVLDAETIQSLALEQTAAKLRDMLDNVTRQLRERQEHYRAGRRPPDSWELIEARFRARLMGADLVATHGALPDVTALERVALHAIVESRR